MQNGLMTGAVDFKYGSVIRTTCVGGTVEIAHIVTGEGRNRSRSIGIALEIVDRGLRRSGKSNQQCSKKNSPELAHFPNPSARPLSTVDATNLASTSPTSGGSLQPAGEQQSCPTSERR